MKLDTSKATVVETESTKYFYIYEISCDGVVIPFNPKYLISYLLNDKLLLQSYSGDVYESVRGTWGTLGTGDQTIQFSLTLEVNTIRLSISELIDAIYNNYNFNSIENVRKLILLAACSKAMLISLLYLIFYNIIDNDDLNSLCEFNFNDLFEYVLNKLKENCLTENPLYTNFESYIDDVSYATGRFCDASDAVVDHDQNIQISVNKDVYKNIFKYNGQSITYDNSQINNEHKLTNSTTDWLYEIDPDISTNKIVGPARPAVSESYNNITIKSLSSVDNKLSFLKLENDVLKNTSEHMIIKIPANTEVRAPVFLWLTSTLKIDQDIVLYPGDSVDLKGRIKNYNSLWGIGKVTFTDNTIIQAKEYKNDWYQSAAEDVRLSRLSMVSGTEVKTTTTPNTPYSAKFKLNSDVGTSNYDILTISNRKIKNNTSDLYIKIPANTSIKVSHWFGGAYNVTTKYAIELNPGQQKTIEFNDPPFSESGLNWLQIAAVRTAKAAYYSISKDSFNVIIYKNTQIDVKSKKYIPVTSATTSVSKNATVFLYGDQYTVNNNSSISLNGLAKVKSNYKTDLYNIDMTVNGLTGASNTQLAQARQNMFSIDNMLTYTPSRGIPHSIAFTTQQVEDKAIVSSSVSSISNNDIDSFACADLTDDNPNTTVKVVPSNVLISPTENIGLSYRPRLTLNLANTELLSKANVEKLIDAMIAAETPVKVTPESENFIIKVDEIKYRPVVDVEFITSPSNADAVNDVYSDLQFILNYTDFEMNINGTTYTTDGASPNLTVEGVDTELETVLTEAEAVEYEQNRVSLNLVVPLFSRLQRVNSASTVATTPNSRSNMRVFNRSKYSLLAKKHPSDVSIVKLRFTGADVLTTIDISDYNIYLYNGNFYKGSDMEG